jgi:uncharacterized protein YdaU (DUF1376 family)
MDTGDWSTNEIGIYLRLLMYEWVNGSLPPETERLARIARCDHGNFKKSWGRSVGGKFTPNGNGMLYNRRLEEEREKQRQYSESRRKGSDAKWAKRDAHADAHASDEHMHNLCIGDSLQSSSSFSDKDLKDLSSKEDMSAGTPADDCPHQEIIKLYHEILPELNRVKMWSLARRKFLKSRWREDKQRQSLEYWKRFFTYVKTCDFIMGRTKECFTCDLEWLIRPKNFINVIEGKYSPRLSVGDRNAQTLRDWVEKAEKEGDSGG